MKILTTPLHAARIVKYRRCSIILLIAIGFLTSSPAQTNRIDSIRNVLNSMPRDTNRVNTHIALGEALRNTNMLEEMIKNADECITLAHELSFKKGEANALNQRGNALSRMEKSDEAIEAYKKSLALRTEIGNKKGMAGSLNNLALIYREKGNFAEAINCLFKAMKTNEEIGNKEWLVINQNNLAICYIMQEKYDKALEMLFAAAQQYDDLGHPEDKHHPYNNIGICYTKMNNHAEALKYFRKASDIRLRIGDMWEAAVSYNNMGNAEIELGQYDSAFVHLNESLRIAREMNHYTCKLDALVNLSEIHLMRGNIKKAEILLDTVYQITQEINSFEALYDYHGTMYLLDSLKGDCQGALFHYKLAQQYDDSISNQESKEHILQQQMQFDFDKKESALKAEQDIKDAVASREIQKQKLVRNGFIGGFALVALFASVFFFQRNKIKKGKKLSDELLLNILPAEVAEELKSKGEADAKLIEHVTVLFTDFVGFTSLSEKLTPKELVRDIHECFSEFDRIIARHGIEKIKTIGDAYMAAGGLPSPNNTHAKDVIQAALEIAAFIEKGKARKIALNQPYFEIRIGVHTGPVVAGIVGVKKFAYDIWGDTVNTAHRMESSGEAGRINISETTYELIKDDSDLSFTSRGKIHAKGKGEMEMFFAEKKTL